MTRGRAGDRLLLRRGRHAAADLLGPRALGVFGAAAPAQAAIAD